MKKFIIIAFSSDMVYSSFYKDEKMAKSKKPKENIDKKVSEYAEFDDPEMTKALQIRFPVALYERLNELAKKERRSFNAEVVYCLEKFFASDASSAMSGEDMRNFLTHLLYPESLPK
jgi:predicted HicB family RNase H-like nuclease